MPGPISGGNPGIGGSTGSTDNAILRADGTGGSALQGSSVTIDDAGGITAASIVSTDYTIRNGGAITTQSFGSQLSNLSVLTPKIILGPDAFTSQVFLVPDGANTFALRNSTNGQTWIVSRTFTDASNYSQFSTVVTGSTVAFTIAEAGSGVGGLTGYTFDKPVTAGANAVKGLITTNANAVTGLVAGALAALTTATIVIYDGTGTAYRVPCLTP